MEQIYENRRANVRAVIDIAFEGNVSAFARAVGKPHTQIFRFLRGGGKNHRNCGERLAREIEFLMGFRQGVLDRAAPDPNWRPNAR